MSQRYPREKSGKARLSRRSSRQIEGAMEKEMDESFTRRKVQAREAKFLPQPSNLVRRFLKRSS
jgi:hypothetical protein